MRITYDEALASLHRAVETKGSDYVYSEAGGVCYYVKDDQPSCIVGHVLSDLGCSLDTLKKYNTSSVNSLLNSDVFAANEKTRILLGTAQDYQDNGETWGEALYEGVGEAEKWERLG